MEDTKAWLISNGLGEYWPKFEEHGWDDLSLLAEMSDVDIEACITKAGHRAKFRKALKSCFSMPVTPPTVNSASHSQSDTHQNMPRAVSGSPVGQETSLDELATIHDAKTQLLERNRLESGTTDSGVDRTECTETVHKHDIACTFPINTESGVDRSGVDRSNVEEAVSGVMMDMPGIIDDNQTENEPNVTSSVTTRQETSWFGETRLECDRNDMSLIAEHAAVSKSHTVVDGTVLEGTESQLMNRGPPNITIIERSENTTVNQGPTQLFTAPEPNDTNNPVAILNGQMEMLADSYRTKDHLFVETKAFNELKSAVEDVHWATLLGKPGDGKSTTAAHLLLQYTERGYDPVFLSSPRDWKMLISDSPSARQVVVIDDMFGQSYLDDNNNVGKWKSLIESMSRIVKQRTGNLLVICISRRYIFKDIETALNKCACFSKHSIVDMTEEQLKLSGDEKVGIFKKFAEAYTIQTSQLPPDIRYVDPPHGFPHCVELYCTNVFLRKKGIAFFRNPVQYVQREICNFRDNDRVKFLVLLLVLHKGESLGHDALDRLTENTTDDDKKFFQTAGVTLETAIPDIHRALTGLTNTYLKQNKDGSYSFSHHSLRETVAFIYISVNPSHAIRALEFQHIVAFTNTKKETAKATVSHLPLPFESLAKRFISEIEVGHGLVVCDCEVWSDISFVNKFMKYIENEQLDFLEKVLCMELSSARLIHKRRYDATIAILENKSIGKQLQNSDKWMKNLQNGLEDACLYVDANIALIKALTSFRFGEGRLKLNGSKLLWNMLTRSKVEEAIVLIDNTHINYQYTGYMGTFFHALASSAIDLPQFEVLCEKLIHASVDINQTHNDIPAVFKCLSRFQDHNCWNRLLCMVNYGANIHAHCKYGNIVSFVVNNSNVYTSSKLCKSILTNLSELDCDFHCTDSKGSNVLHLMQYLRKPDEDSQMLLEYLLHKGVAIKANNNDGVVPLMLALKNNFNVEFINTMAKNSPPKHIDNSGQSYFHYLMSSRSITDLDVFCYKCEILMKLGSSINGKDHTGKPPIVYLMEQNKCIYSDCDLVKLFQFLHENGLDLQVKDDLGRNVVLYVLDWKLTENVLPALHFFDSIGLKLNITDNNGRNALHHLFANAVYDDKVLVEETFSNYWYQVTERHFPEASGSILKNIYDFLTTEIGVLPTTGDKNGINAVMLALENCAGFSWITDLLELDIPLQEDDKGRNYLHYLANSRAPDDKFENLKTILLDKGQILDNNVLKNRPKQRHTNDAYW